MKNYFRLMTADADLVCCSLIGDCLVNIFLPLKHICSLLLQFLPAELFIAFALCHLIFSHSDAPMEKLKEITGYPVFVFVFFVCFFAASSPCEFFHIQCI